jgi:hypothetical protein
VNNPTTIAACTLFEGDYHTGAGSLANSLHASGYRGTFWAGYRGALPPWAASAQPAAPGIHNFAVTPEFEIRFVSLESAPHFAYHKPEFLQRLFSELAPDATAAIYLDPDIVVKCPWSLFSDWLEDGIALVEDINPSLPARHPTRLAWQRVLATRGLAPRRELHRYYNSGFIGLPRTRAAFLNEWQRTMSIVREVLGAQHHHIKAGTATTLFHSTDQDALNMALMLSDVPMNTAGPEAMDFVIGGHYLSHAVGTPKPWQGSALKQALRGYPPSVQTKAFYLHAASPIALFNDSSLRSRRRSLALAALIGRFYRRS